MMRNRSFNIEETWRSETVEMKVGNEKEIKKRTLHSLQQRSIIYNSAFKQVGKPDDAFPGCQTDLF